MIFLRIIAIPLLVFIYFLGLVPLVIRQASHIVLWFLDWVFDIIANIAGWDTRYWPIPKVSDEPLPWKEDDG